MATVPPPLPIPNPPRIHPLNHAILNHLSNFNCTIISLSKTHFKTPAAPLALARDRHAQERLLDCRGATLRRRPVQTSPSSASLPISLQTVGAGPSSPLARPASLGHWCMVVVGAGTRCHRRRHGQVMAGAREGRGGAARGRRAHRNG